MNSIVNSFSKETKYELSKFFIFRDWEFQKYLSLQEIIVVLTIMCQHVEMEDFYEEYGDEMSAYIALKLFYLVCALIPTRSHDFIG